MFTPPCDVGAHGAARRPEDGYGPDMGTFDDHSPPARKKRSLWAWITFLVLAALGAALAAERTSLWPMVAVCAGMAGYWFTMWRRGD